MKWLVCLSVGLCLAIAPFAAGQGYEPRIVNDDMGNKYGIWIVKYDKAEFQGLAAGSTRNTDICLKLRVTKAPNGKYIGTLWRYQGLSPDGSTYQLRSGGAGRITGFEFTIATQGADRKRELFRSNEVTYMDEQGKSRTIKLVGWWHTGKVKKKDNSAKNRQDDVLQMRVLDKPAGGQAKQANDCVNLVQASAPCPEEPDTDVLEEEAVPDPEFSPPYDGTLP